MQNILILTADEKKIFDSLSDTLKDGWKVENEVPLPPDSAAKRKARYELMKIQNAELQSLVQQSMNADVDVLATKIDEMDLSTMSYADLIELFFALGPVSLSAIIAHLLSEARTDDDIRNIGALTAICHSLLPSSNA